MTPMWLLKMVYIAHGWSLALLGRELVSEDIEAWPYGPVIPELYRKLKKYRNAPVLEIPDAIEPNLDDETQKLIDTVIESYGAKSGLTLSQITHEKNTPWDRIRNQKKEVRIPTEVIQCYYQELASLNA